MKKNNPALSLIGLKVANVVRERFTTFVVFENGLRLEVWSLEDQVKKFQRQQKKKAVTPKVMNLYDYINIVLGRKMTWHSDRRATIQRLKPEGNITPAEFKKLEDGLTVSIDYEELSIHNQNYRRYESVKTKTKRETYREVIIRTNHYPSQIIIEQ